MDHPKVSPEEMRSRIVRFNDLKENGIPVMFIDSLLPEHHRMNYAVIGDTASENPYFKPAFSQPHKFQIGMCWAPPGCGPAFHTHDYCEMFMPLSGQWEFSWGNDSHPDNIEGSEILGPWDMISFPPGLYRSFRNVGDEKAWFFAVLDPHIFGSMKDPYWSPQVVEAAEAIGMQADDRGKLIIPDNFDELTAQMREALGENAAGPDGQP